MKRRLLSVGGFLAAVLSMLSGCTTVPPDYNEWSEEDLAAELQGSGLGEKASATIAAGFVEAEDTGSIDPILDLLGEDDDAAFAAAALLVTSEFGSGLLVKALKEDRVPDPVFMIHALAFTQSKEAVDYLIFRLESDEDEGTRDATKFVLRILLPEDAGETASAWPQWWADQRETFSFPDELDMEERTKTFQIQTQRQTARTLRSAVSDALDKVEAAGGERINGLFDGVIDTLDSIADAAEDPGISELASEATSFLRDGNLVEAERIFRKALAREPNDIYALYLLGGLLIEDGSLQEAEGMFSRICALREDTQMAAFLRDFSAYRRAHPTKDLIDSLVAVTRTSRDEEVEAGWLGWNDEFATQVLGQALVDEGPYSIDQAQLQQIYDRHRERVDIVAGVALLRPRAVRLRVLEEDAARFADSVPYQATLLNAQWLGPERYETAVMTNTLVNLQKLDPGNGLFDLLAAYYHDHENRRGVRSFEDPVPSLDDPTLAAVEEALQAPRFDSYERDGVRYAHKVARMMTSPFAEQVAWNGNTLAGPNQDHLDLGRRLRATFDEAEESGEVQGAERVGRAMVRLGERIAEDRGRLITHLVAIAIQTMGYEHLEGLYKRQGRAEDAEMAAKALVELERQKEEAGGAVTAAPLFLVPVPSIQTALVQLAMEDETALSARFAESAPQAEEGP